MPSKATKRPRPPRPPERRDPPSEHATADELGAKAGVSARRIRQLRDEGVLRARRRGRVWVFPVVASLEALKAHRLTGNHGGARAGSGRPSERSKRRAAEAQKSDSAPAPAPGSAPGSAPAPPAPTGPVPGATGVAVDHATALTRAQADAREKAASAEIKQLRLARMREQLVPIDDARSAWAERIRLAREVLDTLAETLADRVCAALRVQDESRDQVEALAREAVDDAIAQLASLRFDAEQETGGVSGGVSGGAAA